MNFITNSEFKLCTALGNVTKYNYQGEGTLPAITVTSTSGTKLITCFTSNTSQLKNGDLIVISTGMHAYFGLSALEVTNLVVNTSFQVLLPLWVTIGQSYSGTFLVINKGDMTASTGDGPDGFQKTTSLKIYRDDHKANKSTAQYYQMALIKGTANTELFVQTLAKDLSSKLVGQILTFSMETLIKATDLSNTARLFIEDDAGREYSDYFTVYGFDRKSVSKKIAKFNSSITVGIELISPAGSLYYISKPDLNISGRTIYEPVFNEHIVPVVKTSPSSMINAAFTFNGLSTNSVGDRGWVFNPYAETSGAIGKGIKCLDLQLEARCDSLDKTLGIRNQEGVPHVYSLLGYSKAVGQMVVSQGLVKLKNDLAYIYSVNNTNWYNTSVDINSIIVN